MGKRGPKPKSIKEKIMSKVFLDASGCWIWQGHKNNKGYGVIPLGHIGSMYVHRASWVTFRGYIPKGLNVLHKCDIPLCFNPEHLFLGTQKENMADMTKKGRRRWTEAFLKSQCKNKSLAFLKLP